MKLKYLIIIIASFISMVSFAQNTINEDFESGALHPLMTIDVVGSFSSAPGIKANDSFGSSNVFGFGKSNCSSSCFDRYKTTLTITFPSPTYVSTIKWKEMEIYGNWGSQGQILLDDVVLGGAGLGAQPVNSGAADASPRINNLIINQTVTTIKFVVNDITSSSEIIIDDLEIQTANQLVGYEYWFNNDYENVHIQAIAPTSQHVLNADIDVSSLPNNVNVFNIRYKDSKGKYSSTLSKLFVKLPTSSTSNASKLVSYEYWFNNDYENVQKNTITATQQDFLQTDIDVSLLPNNVNVFNIRYKDESGLYSSTLSKLFVKLPTASTSNASKLVSYEYWFNNDYENVQKTTITATQQDFLQTDIDVSSLPNNVNVFNIRYKDESGLYSSTLSKLFVKLPETNIVDNKLKEYTYWFDDDFENAITVKLAEEVKVYEWIETIDLPENLAGKDHTINIRFKDQQNVWSVPFEKTFYNEFSPRIEFEGYVDELCFGERIEITPISIDVDSICWDFGDGSNVLLRNGSQKVYHQYEAAGEYEIKVTYKHIATGDEFDTEDIVDSIVLPIIIHPAYGSKEVREYVFFEDFESNETGKLPDGWNLVYNGTGDANQKVVESPVMNGSKSLQLEGRSSWSAHLSKTIEEFPEQFTVEAWMQTNSLAAGGVGAGAGSLIVSNMNLGSWGSDIARVSFNGGNIIYFNRQGTSYSPHFILGSYETNEWYHIQMEVDLAAKTTQIYINNQLAEVEDSEGNLINEFPIHPTVEPAEITVSAGNGGTCKMFFDDVNMYEDETISNILPTVDLSICEADLPYLFGTQELMESGVYLENFQTTHGCDSVVTLNFTVLPNPNVEITQNKNVLTVQQADASYQWLDCDNDFAPIEGATEQSYTISKDGNYAVEVTLNGCSLVSDCTTTLYTSNKEINRNYLTVYPNPTNDKITIDIGVDNEEVIINLMEIDGKRIASHIIKNERKLTIQMPESNGIYLIQLIRKNHESKVVKVIKIP